MNWLCGEKEADNWFGACLLTDVATSSCTYGVNSDMRCGIQLVEQFYSLKFYVLKSFTKLYHTHNFSYQVNMCIKR